jgi:UTP--glucose-1-phosphate uridylyltransferase
MHVRTPAVLDILGELLSGAGENEPVQLSAALARLADKERYLALEIHGLRYNIGLRYGLLVAQLALALDGNDREEIMAQMIELLAMRGRTA